MLALRAWGERLRSSMFFVPASFVAAAVVLSLITTRIDAEIRLQHERLPELFLSTVDSARALLSVIASATIAFAGISISISLLLIQLASSQFSPRVLYGFFRDPVTKWVTGIVIGTFTYCLLVLRVVRTPLESNAPPVVPHLSVVIATILGVGSILAVILLINHSARSMQVGEIIRRITDEGRHQIEGLPEPDTAATSAIPRLDGSGFAVLAEDEGWVQLLDMGILLEALPERTTCDLRATVGGFVPLNSVLCTLHPEPESSISDRAAMAVRRSIHLGRSRTTQQDVAFAFRQLVDIALRALSPGINDPTTAQESIVHLGSLLGQLLRHGVGPARLEDERGRRIISRNALGLDDFVNLAFDQIRIAGASTPGVAIDLLEVIGVTIGGLERTGTTAGVEALRRQARLVVEQTSRSDALAADVETVLAVARTNDLAPSVDPILHERS
ncbi:MAG: DUF2254 domain-containing protein [Actinomycetota bacterium]